MTDSQYMQRALELAASGWGWVNPNPLVGAVIVKDGRIIGEGYHRRFGAPHAEREALASCSESPEGATLYVTLEPCCHSGKTPPCTEAIIPSGISKVVMGSHDPNPLVAGGGKAQLLEAGIEVATGCKTDECDRLNRIFFYYIRNKSPYVLLKYAMTADGKVATRTGASRWISGEESRNDTHWLRGRYAAIMAGIGTVMSDDPLLNCRIEGGHDPLRVICDSSLRISPDSQIAKSAKDIPTLIATCPGATDARSRNENARRQLEEQGCEVAVVPEKEGHVDLAFLMELLGQRGIDSVLVEGGPTLHGAALEAGVVNAIRCYIAPMAFGGTAAPSPIGGLGVAAPAEAYRLKNVEYAAHGNDISMEGEVV